jgi:hypothetical protein
MRQGISEIFCDGRDAKGEAVAVYRALRQLFCSACGTPINAGGLFTRRGVPGFGPRILPRCGKCAPFEMTEATAAADQVAADEVKAEPDEVEKVAEGTRSEMIEKLLTPEPGAGKEESEARPRDMSEEAARRLGPALSRSRRKPQ